MSFRTLAEMLKQSVEKYSDLMCSQMLGNTKMTFKELGERVEKVKQLLVGAGLKEGDKVALSGFGIFEVRDREARTGRNPHTKETVEIPATRVPAFKASKALKDAVKK